MYVGSMMMSATIAASANMGNMGIGVKGHRLPLMFCFVIAALSMTTCLLGGFSALHIEHMMSPRLCSFFGSGVLVTVGLWTMLEALYHQIRPEETTGMRFGFHEMMLMGLAQALADLSVGLGIGFSHVAVWFTAVCVGVFSLLFLLMPSQLFTRWTTRMGQHTAMVSGTLLVVAGLLL
ncbi:manganese efflux pump [Alicyclobacillus pomorum]|jgi:putative Mn2+ efflux pump MntP|uniref:manganese efflux pump n=1 Tax=Alicyclobacillus pomorum TaxID=204470 RepID=UPI0004205199|nr:manganese efflux pump [Alicyclobacillus pomorum]